MGSEERWVHHHVVNPIISRMNYLALGLLNAIEKIDARNRAIEWKVNKLGEQMSDFRSELESEEAGISSDIDALSAKLTAQDANELTQADVDAIHALKVKADAALAASPLTPAGGDTTGSTDSGTTTGDTGSTGTDDSTGVATPDANGEATLPSDGSGVDPTATPPTV